MNTYLISTAILSVGLDGAIAPGGIEPVAVAAPHQNQFALKEALQTNTSRDFANGDFMAIAKSTLTGSMYAGDGSREMMSTRSFKF